MRPEDYERKMKSKMWAALDRLGCVFSMHRDSDDYIRPLKIDIHKIINLTDRELVSQKSCGPVTIKRIHTLQESLKEFL